MQRLAFEHNRTGQPARLAAELWRRYIFAIAIVAASLIVSHVASVQAMRHSDEASLAINIAGRQRMLSQRIMFLASEDLVARGPDATAPPMPELTDAVALFKASHEALMRGGSMGLSAQGAEARLPIFKQVVEGRSLASLVPAFIYLAEIVQTGRYEERALAFSQIRPFGHNRLLGRLDLAVQGMETEALAVAKRTRTVSLVSMFAALGILLLEVLFIFRPATRLVAKTLEELDISQQEQMAARQRAEKANTKAQAALTSQTKFFGYMSHEMRTPLNGIIGMLGLLKEKMPKKDRERYLFHASSAAEHLLNMLSNVLDLSKLEVGMMRVINAPYSPAEVVETAVQLFEGQARIKALNLRFHIEGHVPEMVVGDRSRMLQVVTNLIGNAVKFTDTGSVDVTLQVNDGPSQASLRIDIADTGPGLNLDALPDLFKDFTTADLTAEKSAMGSGLGLSISRQLVEKMDGEITAQNRADGGSLFRLMIPCEVVAVHNERADDLVSLEATAPIFEGRHVLIVDDNETNRLIAQAYVKSCGGITSVAQNGQEAVALFAKADDGAGLFDLVLMDQRMPVMDGLQATTIMRTLMRTAARHTPILMVSANISSEDRDNARSAGADGFLPKPLRRAALVEAAAVQFDRSQSQGDSASDQDGYAA